MSAGENKATGVDQIGRRTWDTVKYAQLAQEREAREAEKAEEKRLGS